MVLTGNDHTCLVVQAYDRLVSHHQLADGTLSYDDRHGARRRAPEIIPTRRPTFTKTRSSTTARRSPP
jgi:hypothetical protein